jgi:K+-transporting ATPase KdpF subunit
MAPCNVFSWPCQYGDLFYFSSHLSPDLGERPFMIYVTAVVAILLFAYLILTLIRPEWF